MFVELLEKLRCPNHHEAASLVATASRTVNRHIMDGALGCPVCHAEFQIRDGALELGAAGARPLAGSPPPEETTSRASASPPDSELANQQTLRTGALLGLDERAGR